MARAYSTIGAIALVTLMLAAGCSKQADHTASIEMHKKLATELRDNRLYDAAVQEYQKILAYDNLDDATRANINYLIARIYFDHVQNYGEAAAYYVRAKTLDPKADFIDEASRNLVTALEKSGNLVTAKRQLNQMTDIAAKPANDSDVAVARIGGVPVWRSQVEDALAALPPDVQKQVLSKGSKVDFMHQYVGTELLYHAALRENYDKDPDIEKQMSQYNRNLLVQKYVLDNVIPKIQIDTADVRNFYQANKASHYNDAPYDSVKAQVFLDYQSQKAQSAYADYISMLAQKEHVEFFDENVK